MIGNDIIDLILASEESNWQRSGFLTKLFTSEEQLFISNADIPETMVWYLWSLKEAAYKIYNRQTQIRAFIPLQLKCFDIETKEDIYYGKVCCDGQLYFTKTYIASDCIDTVAVLNKADFDRIETLDNNVSIQKKNGIPYYLSGNTVLKSMSKSHHGRFERIVTLIE